MHVVVIFARFDGHDVGRHLDVLSLLRDTRLRAIRPPRAELPHFLIRRQVVEKIAEVVEMKERPEPSIGGFLGAGFRAAPGCSAVELRAPTWWAGSQRRGGCRKHPGPGPSQHGNAPRLSSRLGMGG